MQVPSWLVAASIVSCVWLRARPSLKWHIIDHCTKQDCHGQFTLINQMYILRLWPLGGLAFCSSGGGAKGDLLVALAGRAQRDVNARKTHDTCHTCHTSNTAFGFCSPNSLLLEFSILS